MADNTIQNEAVNRMLTTNPTGYRDEPITPEKTELVIQNIVIRSTIRTTQDIESWRNAHIAAESRYWPNRSRLYDLYEDVMLDGHLSGIIRKRIDSVLNKPITFLKDGKEVDGMPKLIASAAFRQVLEILMLTPAWGISGLEFINGPALQVRSIPRKHIKTKTQTIAIEQNDPAGIDYTKLANVWIVGNPEDLGYLLKCGQYAILKRGAVGDWANFVQIYGQPVRVIRYDGHDKQSKEELKNSLDEAGPGASILIPKQAEFEIMDGKTSNSDGQLQQRFKDSMNQEMSLIVLGNTETSTGNKDGGSLAKSKVHQDQQLEITKSDMMYITGLLNDPHFINILKSYGLPVDGGHFAFKREINIDTLDKRADIDQKIINLGVPVAHDYFYETYDIPKPDNYNQLVEEQEAKNNPKDTEEVENEEEDNPEGALPEGKTPEDLIDIKIAVPRKGLFSFFHKARH